MVKILLVLKSVDGVKMCQSVSRVKKQPDFWQFRVEIPHSKDIVSLMICPA